MTADERELYKEQLKLLDDSLRTLIHSYEKCQKINLADSPTLDELDSFEALSSRFARISDILIQKVFRLIDIIELEDAGSVIDRINRAEKRGLINSAETFKKIRRLRNDIAHEYISTAIQEIFKKVLYFSPDIIDCVARVKKYEVKE